MECFIFIIWVKVFKNGSGKKLWKTAFKKFEAIWSEKSTSLKGKRMSNFNHVFQLDDLESLFYSGLEHHVPFMVDICFVILGLFNLDHSFCSLVLHGI